MRLFNGFCCFLCGSLAVLLYVGPANRDRHVKAALASLDAVAAFTNSDAALASPELRTALADPNTRDPVADPVIKVPLAEPEVNASPLEASDECADKRGLNAKVAEKGNAATSGVAKAAKPRQALQGRAELKPLL